MQCSQLVEWCHDCTWINELNDCYNKQSLDATTVACTVVNVSSSIIIQRVCFTHENIVSREIPQL